MELIDRRKLVDDFWKGVEDGSILSYEDTDDLMENAPTVDAVEVVRCKDCKWMVEFSGKDSGKPCGYGYCKNPIGLMGIAYNESYCSYGERKDNE